MGPVESTGMCDPVSANGKLAINFGGNQESPIVGQPEKFRTIARIEDMIESTQFSEGNVASSHSTIRIEFCTRLCDLRTPVEDGTDTRATATANPIAVVRHDQLRWQLRTYKIIPAPTVTPVASSIKMNEPVVRFFE